MKQAKYILLVFLLIALAACKRYDHFYQFYDSKSDMYITTFKAPGKFYILMSPFKYETEISEQVDYIEIKIGDYINIIVDSLDNRKIVVWDNYGKRKPQFHQFHYNIFLKENCAFENMYLKNDSLNERYTLLSIATDIYNIILNGDRIKRGTIWGD